MVLMDTYSLGYLVDLCFKLGGCLVADRASFPIVSGLSSCGPVDKAPHPVINDVLLNRKRVTPSGWRSAKGALLLKRVQLDDCLAPSPVIPSHHMPGPTVL
ncbi:hypothetical protein Aduo_002367 [Ancylostoma duodenale]